MEDVVLKARLDDSSDLYMSPIDRQTYDECVTDNNLGGDGGYFILRSFRGSFPRLEVLAKAATLEAAHVLFDWIVAAQRSTSNA